MKTPLKCWTKAGYIRKPGTKKGEPGSCYKPSPNKVFLLGSANNIKV